MQSKIVSLVCQRCGVMFEAIVAKKATKFCKMCSKLNRKEYRKQYDYSRRNSDGFKRLKCCVCDQVVVTRKMRGDILCSKCDNERELEYLRINHENKVRYFKEYNAKNKAKRAAYYVGWRKRNKQAKLEEVEKKEQSFGKVAWTAYQLMRLPAEKWEKVLSRPGFCITEIGSIPYGKITAWNWIVANG